MSDILCVTNRKLCYEDFLAWIERIDADNIALVRDAGASGACLMSSLMASEDVEGFMKAMEG